MKTSVKQQQQILYNFTDVLRHGEAKIITGKSNQRTEAESTLEPVLGVQNNEREEAEEEAEN